MKDESLSILQQTEVEEEEALIYIQQPGPNFRLNLRQTETNLNY